MMKTKNKSEKLRHLKSGILAIIFVLFMGITAFGQERVITGVVSDNKGESLPGVSVLITGTTTGVVTDLDGKFSIKATNDATLRFSFVGYVSQEIKVNDQTSINVVLSEDVKELNEVVVIGYGVQKKSDLTGAVASVSAKDMQALPAMKVDEALEGHAAGVNVVANSGMPGGSSTIQIRGVSSINGANPLVVVDGIPGVDMNSISPNDIESVEILKDAASTAIYGSNGGNGVILITTKKGHSGKITTSLNFFTGIQNVSNELKMMNSTQWNNLYAEMNKGVPFTMNADTLSKNFDWQKALYKPAQMQNFDVNVSGGNEVSKFALGMNYMNQDGLIKNTGYKKMLMSISSSHNLSKHIKLDEVVHFSNDKQTGPAEWQYSNAYNNYTTMAALNMLPFQTPYEANGKWTVPLFGGINPFTGVDEKSDQYSKNLFIDGNFGGSLEIIKGLTYSTRFYGKAGDAETWQYLPEYHASDIDFNNANSLNQSIDRQFSWTYQNYITYNTTILQAP